jgi:hypothetical protein
MKKFNIYKFIWISCIFLVLIAILICIIDYKVNYQYIEEVSPKLYFYECDGELCTSQVEDTTKKNYSIYDCWYNECPTYKGIVNENYALLEEKEGYILYDYKNGTTISSGYESYQFIDNNYIIVSKNNKEGIIDLSDNVIVESIYDKIGYDENDYLIGFNTEYIIAKKDNKYGLISYKDGSIKEEFKYDETSINELLKSIS